MGSGVPRPREDPIFRWEYTYLADDGFNDGRIPQALTLACDGVSFPEVVLEAPRPSATQHGSGPWWLGQDAAAGTDTYAENVLKLAVLYGLLPVLSRLQLAAAPEVDVIAVRTMQVPVYDDHSALGHRLVQTVRERVRQLTLDAHAGRGDDLLRELAAGLRDLRDAHPGARECTVRIGLARFPYRPWRQGPKSQRVHPIIVKAERARPARELDPEPGKRVPTDGELKHPTEQLLAQLDAGKTAGVRAWLRASDRTAGQACGMAGMILARERLRQSQLVSEAHQGADLEGPPSSAEHLIEEAWRRADELGSAGGAYELASLLDERGALVEAEAAALRADDRGSASGAFLLGLLLARRGETTAAEDAYRRGDERGHRAAAFNLGLSLNQRGLDVEAAVALGRADERGGARAPTILGMRLGESGDIDGAVAAFRRGDERGDGPAAYFLGKIAEERGDDIEAEAAWRRADARGEPRSATALGVQHVARDDLAAAEAAFARADDRGDGPGAYLRGRYLQQRGQEDDASAAYARAADRGVADAAYRLGAQRYAVGDSDGAEAAWRRAAELGSTEGSFNLAHELVNKGKLDEALPLLRDATLSRDPDIYPRAAFVFGSILVRIGRLQEARTLLQLAVQSGHLEVAPTAAAELAALDKRAVEEPTGASLSGTSAGGSESEALDTPT